MKEKKLLPNVGEKPKLTIIGFKNNPRWKTKLKCVCGNTQDFKNCKFCNYQNCEDTVPREPFFTHNPDTKKKDKILITKIEIDRGSDDEIRGFCF